MSKKKYKVGYFEDPVDIDDYVETIDGEYLDASDVVRLLNKLSDENEQLKGEVKRLKCINKQLEDRLGRDIALNMDCGDSE